MTDTSTDSSHVLAMVVTRVCRTLALLLPSDTDVSTIEYEFDQYKTLPANLVPTSEQVMKFARRYLDTDSKQFHWSNFKTAIDNYPGDDLTFDKYQNTTINQSTATVTIMANKLVDFFYQGVQDVH